MADSGGIGTGFLGSGMGKGPALAMLLAGPALNLPSMLVISSIIGPRRTAIYVVLVVATATFTGWLYGMIVIFFPKPKT